MPRTFLILALITSISLSSLQALADWSGIWEGPGRFTDNVKSELPWTAVGLMLTQTETTLEQYSLGECGIEAWKDLLTFEIQGEDLWLDGEKVGTLTDSELSYVLSQPEHEYLYRADIRRGEGETLLYSDSVEQRLYRSQVEAALSPL